MNNGTAIYTRTCPMPGETFTGPSEVTFDFQKMKKSFVIYFLNSNSNNRECIFIILGTGWPIPGEKRIKRIVASAMMPEGDEVYHLCEVV